MSRLRLAMPIACVVGFGLVVVERAVELVGYAVRWPDWAGVVMQAALSASALLLALGAFELARRHEGARRVAARLAGAVMIARVVALVVGQSAYGLLPWPLSQRLELAKALDWTDSLLVPIAALAFAMTARHRRIALALAAVVLAAVQEPIPPLADRLDALIKNHTALAAAIYIAVMLAAPLVQLIAIESGARGGSGAVRPSDRVVASCKMIGYAAWASCALSAIAVVVMMVGRPLAGSFVVSIGAAALAVPLVTASLRLARSSALPRWLVTIGVASAITVGFTAIDYVAWVLSDIVHPIPAELGDLPTPNELVTCVPLTLLASLWWFAAACVRDARRRAKPPLVRSLALQFAVFTVACGVAVFAGDAMAVCGLTAVGCGVIAGGFFATAHELATDVADPVAEVFA